MPIYSIACGDIESGSSAQIKMRVAPQPAPIHSCCGEGCCSDCAGISRARISPSDGRVKLSIEPVPGYRLDYNNQVQDNCVLANVDFANGTNWMVAISPALIKYTDGSGAIRFCPDEGYWFGTPSGFAPQFGAKVSLSLNAGANEYVLAMAEGTVYRFHDFTQSTYPRGSFKSYTTPGGTDVTAISYNAGGFIEEIQKSLSVPGQFGSEDTVVESLLMQYAPTGPSESLQVQTVTARRKINGIGGWAVYARASMAYWASGDKGGQVGNLKRVDREVPAGTGWAVTGSHYFRYFTGGNSGVMQFWLSPESTRRLSEDAGVSSINTAPDETLRMYAANNRVTSFIYDFRGRQTAVDGEVDFYQVRTFDNLNQLTQVDRKNTTSGGNLVARMLTLFDDLGRVYKRLQVSVNPSTGTAGDSLVLEDVTRDGKGLVIKSKAGKQAPVRLVSHDGLGNAIQMTVGYRTGGFDYVFDQLDTLFNEASQAIQRTLLQRYHDDTTTTGPLTAGTNARPQYTASYFDGVGRPVATAAYGTNGGVALSRSASVPARSDDVLVSETRYNDKGEAFESVDPMARVTHRDFDDAGRPVATIENTLPGSTASDANITVAQAYDAKGRLASVTAKNPDTGDQVTSYHWGVSDPTSDLASNSLLREMRFPGGKLDVTSQAYNRQGQVKEWTDQNGTVHGYVFDKLGRTTADELLAVGLNIDTAIMKIGLSYEVRGLVEKITSYDGASVVKNEVENAYNGLGMVAQQYQEHTGAKSGSTPYLVYYFDTSASAGEFTKDMRPTRIDYPDGNRLFINYGAASGAGDKMSRIEDLNDGTAVFVVYQYLGMSTFVRVDYQEADVAMQIDHGTAHAYAGFDRFNRIIDLPWLFNGTTDLDRFKYGYDRNSNPLFAYNSVDTDFGNQYAYDALNRLTDAKRGTINTGTGVVADPDHREVYDLDATGNWNGYFVQDGQTTWKQRRAFNQVNEITDLTNWVVPEYDLAGNMTTIPEPAEPTEAFTLTWDGWNRLVKVVGATLGDTYAYDGLMRRQTSNDKTTIRHFYYSLGWQVVEERLNALTTADAQYVWGLRYIDDLVRRLKGTGENSVIYALKDRMWSISSLVTGTEGAVLERYVYDPYGKPTVLTGAFGPRTSSLYGWSYLFQGREWDSLTGLYQFRMRYYHSGLALFLSRDRLLSKNVYTLVGGSPTALVDPSGLQGLHIDFEQRPFGPKIVDYGRNFMGVRYEYEYIASPGFVLLQSVSIDATVRCASKNNRVIATLEIDFIEGFEYRKPIVGFEDVQEDIHHTTAGGILKAIDDSIPPGSDVDVDCCCYAIHASVELHMIALMGHLTPKRRAAVPKTDYPWGVLTYSGTVVVPNENPSGDFVRVPAAVHHPDYVPVYDFIPSFFMQKSPVFGEWMKRYEVLMSLAKNGEDQVECTMLVFGDNWMHALDVPDVDGYRVISLGE